MTNPVDILDGLKRAVEITIPWQEIDLAVHQKMEELRCTQQIKGFRRGKTPLTMMRRLYGRSVQLDCANARISEHFSSLMKEKESEIAAIINTEIISCNWGRETVFRICYEEQPRIVVQPLDQLIIKERFTFALKEEDVTNLMQTLGRQWGKYYSRSEGEAVQEYDMVTCDIKRILNDEITHDHTDLVWPAGLQHPKFPHVMEMLKDMKSGETQSWEQPLSEELASDTANNTMANVDYDAQSIVKYQIHIKNVQGLSPMDPNTLAEHYGSTPAAFKEILYRHLQAKGENLLYQLQQRHFHDAILAAHTFDVPSAWVTRFSEQMREQKIAELKETYGDKVSSTKIANALTNDAFTSDSERQMRIHLLTEEYQKQQEDTEVLAAEIDAELEKFAYANLPFIDAKSEPLVIQKQLDEVIKQRDHTQVREKLKTMILERRFMTKVYETAHITRQSTCNFHELINRLQNNRKGDTHDQ